MPGGWENGVGKWVVGDKLEGQAHLSRFSQRFLLPATAKLIALLRCEIHVEEHLLRLPLAVPSSSTLEIAVISNR